MDSISGPVVAGIIVSLLNRYVLDFKWCTLPENWYDDDVEVDHDHDRARPDLDDDDHRAGPGRY